METQSCLSHVAAVVVWEYDYTDTAFIGMYGVCLTRHSIFSFVFSFFDDEIR